MHKIRKSIIFAGIIFLFSLWGSPALTVAGAEGASEAPVVPPNYQPQQPGKGAILFCVSDPKGALAGRSVTATASLGPADDAAASATLSGLNDFAAAVELPPGDYFCAAAVDYDPARDYPLVEEDNLTTASVTAGETTVLTYAVNAAGYYQSITGKNRYFQEVELEPAPEGYDPAETAQIGSYLTAPENFNHTVVVYLANRYTGTGYTLEVYAANQLAALNAKAEAGKYQYLGARLPDDDSGRYQISAEQDVLSTNEGATFHLTVTDTVNTDRKLVTPSRADAADPAQPDPPTSDSGSTPEATTAPTSTEKAKFSVHVPVLEIVILAVIGAILFISWKRKSKE